MNLIKAKVLKIQKEDNLHIVNFDFDGIKLKMMSLDLNEKIKENSKVLISTKATQIALAKNLSGELSYSNQLRAKVIEVENGKLLSSIQLEVKNTLLESIITKDSSLRMNIKKGEEISILIKANELAIMEVLEC